MEWAFHTTFTSNLLTFLPSSCTIASFDCDMCPLLMTPPPKWAFPKVKRWNGGTDPDFKFYNCYSILFHFLPPFLPCARSHFGRIEQKTFHSKWPPALWWSELGWLVNEHSPKLDEGGEGHWYGDSGDNTWCFRNVHHLCSAQSILG